MKLLSFKNMPIIVKFFIVPVIAMLFLFSLGVLSTTELKKQTIASDNIYNVIAKKSSMAKQINEKAIYINGNLFRMMIWTTMSDDDSKIQKIISDIDANASEIDVLFEDLNKNFELSNEEKNYLTEAYEGIKKYNKSVKEAVEMTLIDVDLSFMYATTAESEFAVVEGLLKKLNDLADRIGHENFNNSMRNAENAETLFIEIVSAALLILILITFFISQLIAKPVKNLTATMEELAEGNLEVEIPDRNRTDEIGAMSSTVQVFKDNAIEMKRLEAEQKEAEEKKELLEEENRKKTEEAKIKAEEERKQTMITLADNFEASIKGIVHVVSSSATEMQSSAEGLSVTSEQVSNQAGAAAAATEQASSNVATVATATEELTASISEISQQVNSAAEMSRQSTEEALGANKQIQGLLEATGRIGEVINLINDIASQTNLLALNATIEAARAGDMGKGFAVVASEVKNLASQTANATEEIASQITEVQDATADSVKAIESITTIINNLSEINSSIASAMEEQSVATQEISRNVQEASIGTSEVATNVSGVNQSAGETGRAATELLKAANTLSEEAVNLSNDVDAFIAKIRED